jgi:ribosomal protein S19
MERSASFLTALVTYGHIGRADMAGPFFTAFPSLSTALKSGTPIYTKSRACTVLPNFVGLKFMVHNGKDYLPVQIGEEMVGHKLGEFAPTRKMFSYRCVTLFSWLG